MIINYMIIAADETGEFRDVLNAKFGLVTLVTITDSEWCKFNEFMNNIYAQGYSHIKGSNIDWNNREKILKYIGTKTQIRYVTLLYDLGSGSDEWVQQHKEIQLSKIDKALNNTLLPSMIKDLNLFKNQLKKCSLADYAKLIMFIQLFSDWQQYFQFDYVYTSQKSDTWKFRTTVDMQNEPYKFKRLLQGILKLSGNELNPNYQIYSPKEWDGNHPFNIRHTYNNDPSRINFGILYEDFNIGDEKKDLCLFLPDLIGNTVYNSITKQKDKRWLKILKRIKPNRSIVMTRKDNSLFYLVRGFDKSKTKADVSVLIQDHYRLMRSI